MKESSDKSGIKAFFEGIGGGLKESYAPTVQGYAHRIDLVEAGVPLDVGDADPKKLGFLKKEFMTMGGDALKEHAGKVKDYKLPELKNILKKGPDGNLVKHEAAVSDYKWSMALTPLAEEGARDFRAVKNLQIKMEGDRVAFSTDQHLPYEKYTYDMKKLMMSVLGESQDRDQGESNIFPYAHTDKDGHVESKSLIILNQAEREQFRDTLIERFKQTT